MVAKRPQVPEMTTSDMAAAMSKHGFKLFTERGGVGLPLNKAQRALEGRTDYVTDAVLKRSVSKIHDVHVMDDGLVLGIVESIQRTADANEGRVFRTVFFDIFGRVLFTQDKGEELETQKGAMAEFWKQSEEIDAVAETREGVKNKCIELSEELKMVEGLLEDLK